MRTCDALIVGGGPAGSSCARVLRNAGWDVVVIDRARFPRDKVCAGWVTPGVFRLLDLDPADYRATGYTIQEITGFKTSVLGERSVDTRYRRVISYAIRRCEFDDFLLRRSGARVLPDTPLRSLVRHGDTWVANDEISAPVVIGAGGHFCPVARYLVGGSVARSDPDSPRNPPHVRDAAPYVGRVPRAEQELSARGPAVVLAKEAEFKIEDGSSTVSGTIPELFFCRDLEGYGWCVRKGDYLNIGLGRRDHGDLNPHVDDFIGFLEREGLARRAALVRWRGHAYLASGTGPRPLVGDGVLLAGDAAGLAYPESGEGIKPAVESGRLAAETLLAANGRFRAGDLRPYDAELRRRYPPARATPPALSAAVKALGRRLLRSPAFTRHVVVNRWFLREGH